MNNSVTTIVAVTFGAYSAKNGFTFNDERPYFYIDLLGLQVGDVGLIHNGTHFGIVRIVRIIDHEAAPQAMLKITKPVLARIDYDHALISTASEKIDEFSRATVMDRVNSNIDRELGITPTEAVEKHQRSIQANPRFQRVEQKDEEDLD